MASTKPSPKQGEAVDVYRVVKLGTVLPRFNNNDESIIPVGTFIDPATVDNPATLERLVEQGMIKKISVMSEPGAVAKNPAKRPPDPKVVPILPTTQTRYTSAIHHLVVNRLTSRQDVIIPKGGLLPADIDQSNLDRLVTTGLVTAIEVSY